MICCYISLTLTVLETKLDECLTSLKMYDFLWEQDLHTTCGRVFQGATQEGCYDQVERFLDIERKVYMEMPIVGEGGGGGGGGGGGVC